ncbi:MAG: pseudouridine-5'-phosphate glycosidase [Bacilli bacterium]|nr:pseudouridine-5'-phosphate glycosidase [Bacilli bacterium]
MLNKELIKKYVSISKEVKDALDQGKPVVALESTIISHGMPYPKNAQTAYECERVVRENGATPAIIAIINGVLKVGLTDEEVDYLAKEGRKVAKVSRRDIAHIVANKLNGATTVASTMIISEMVGIKIFATGGIGGVHRGAEATFDISADLEELAKTNVAVICAGPKAILDLPKTLEYLETKGVDVIGVGTNKLPAFYSSTSNYNVAHRYDEAESLAHMLSVKWELGLNGGVLINNPIPKEYEIKAEVIDEVISKALAEMNDLGIKGQEVTPFLLAKVVELTKGASLEANIKLVLNNCAFAAKVARALNKDK